MSDLIDRQAAIDVVRWWYKNIYGEDAEKWICESIENLPSAEPEIIRCKDCKWHEDDYCSNIDVFGFSNEDFCSLAQRKEGDELDGKL